MTRSSDNEQCKPITYNQTIADGFGVPLSELNFHRPYLLSIRVVLPSVEGVLNATKCLQPQTNHRHRFYRPADCFKLTAPSVDPSRKHLPAEETIRVKRTS
jgi:hypothetical protein